MIVQNYLSKFQPHLEVSLQHFNSSYKNHNTAKGLLEISPAGYPAFVSELYAGRYSDKQVTKDCGILTLLESGDDIMADKGFDIADDMPAGVGLNIPTFLNGASQLSLNAENETRKVAALRVHVERAIQCIKCFKILKNVFPLKMSSDLRWLPIVLVKKCIVAVKTLALPHFS